MLTPLESLPPSFWHTRYMQQAQWTRSLRLHLYNRANIAKANRVLEVGCGTGVILNELLMQSHGMIQGLDISKENIAYTGRNLPGIPLTQADANALPFPGAIFDITLCHFLLLWVTNPVWVLNEMARVTKPDGTVLALAEPDYGGRIDYPVELSVLGDWQQAALFQQGADPLLGRKLRSAFHQAGLVDVEAGVLGGQWSGIPSADDIEMEWKVLEDDIKVYQKAESTEIKKLHELDAYAWEQGERVLYVPTFYAWGRRP